ncbi:MAG: hypothetical protein COS89_03040 [Deltaproteobacteria bacterium CG07_land_8_20_14_0_80_38_7]|nr:MAG: hypothetical protein COS89_03040 [Deltaproteobacteria bacterium CG07_land_8_20_14_0_80_38_7]
MKKNIVTLLAILTVATLCYNANAAEVSEIRKTIYSGQVEKGAQELVNKNTPEALLLLGQTLDRLADLFSERAEMTCYWGKGTNQTPACMQTQAEKLNAIYGKGSFKAISDIAYIPYTGTHYQKIIKKFPKSDEASEAAFQLLLKDLVGHPDVVLPKIKKFISKHPNGAAFRRGLLLWARVNQDIWYIHREWSWVIYNDTISPDDLLIKAEPYRQEAIKAYEKLAAYSGTFEAKAAREELKLLKANRYDNEVYSILADSVGGSPEKWGTPIPSPKLKAGNRGVVRTQETNIEKQPVNKKAVDKKTVTKTEPKKTEPKTESKPKQKVFHRWN